MYARRSTARPGASAERELVAARLTAQLLSGPAARDPVGVAERLLAVQAQELRGARLTVRARTEGLSVADLDRALAARELVVSWLNRGTLHLVRREDYPWLHALTTPQLATGCARRLAQEGVTPDAAERGVAAVERALAGEGPLTRAQLRERVAAAGVRTEGQALVHLLFAASLRGICVRGPMAGREQAFVLRRDWLGEPPRVDRDTALAELARRYLAGHGPAGAPDLARWAGLPLRDARAGLARIAAELTERPDGLVDLAGRPPAEPVPPPRLLGPYEPLLLGWVSRAPLVGGGGQGLVTSNGIVRPFALVDGRAVAIWRLADGGGLELEPFERVRAADVRALEREARDVRRFLG
ncbi:MAG TPA: winged helix DNA-binding domain-containing protein [Gaiellaceae bacterium]|nr:winged helix DNA-binding domain-containing protein [Gaiellaceae bacterium]